MVRFLHALSLVVAVIDVAQLLADTFIAAHMLTAGPLLRATSYRGTSFLLHPNLTY